MSEAAADKQRVLALLVQHGWNSTSFQILEPGFQYWFDGDDACVGYVDTGNAWVAAGPPIAAAERIADVVGKFAAAAREEGRRACCFGTEVRFGELAQWQSVRIGEQPVWDPAEWDATIKQSKSLREQLRRARAKGVVVEELSPAQLAVGQPLRDELERLVHSWQRSQALAPMGFLVKVELFSFAAERRYFVARRSGTIVAFLGVIPIYARRGWFFEDFIRSPAVSRHSRATSHRGCGSRGAPDGCSTTSTAFARSRPSSSRRAGIRSSWRIRAAAIPCSRRRTR